MQFIYYQSLYFGMINSYLTCLSPEKPAFRRTPVTTSTLMHMTCYQLCQLTIKYDDIVYQQRMVVTKVMVCAQILAIKQELSPLKKLMKTLTIRDSTGIYYKNIHIFMGSEYWDKIDNWMKDKRYVNICMDTKCSGLYRFQIKFNVISLKMVEDHNEIALHYSQVIKDYIERTRR